MNRVKEIFSEMFSFIFSRSLCISLLQFVFRILYDLKSGINTQLTYQNISFCMLIYQTMDIFICWIYLLRIFTKIHNFLEKYWPSRPVKYFPWMLRKMKISLYDNWRLQHRFGDLYWHTKPRGVRNIFLHFFAWYCWILLGFCRVLHGNADYCWVQLGTGGTGGTRE